MLWAGESISLTRRPADIRVVIRLVMWSWREDDVRAHFRMCLRRRLLGEEGFGLGSCGMGRRIGGMGQFPGRNQEDHHTEVVRLTRPGHEPNRIVRAYLGNKVRSESPEGRSQQSLRERGHQGTGLWQTWWLGWSTQGRLRPVLRYMPTLCPGLAIVKDTPGGFMGQNLCQASDGQELPWTFLNSP